MRVKCICNDNGELDLTVGKVYEIQEETYNKFYIKNDSNLTWGYLKKRFEIVK